MNHDRLIDIAGYAIGVIGGLFLIIGAFVRMNRMFASKHLRIAMVIAGMSCCGWGTLGLIDRTFQQQFTARTHALLHHYKGMLSGSALGILLLEFVSGEFMASRRRYKQAQRELQGSDGMHSNES
jgi:hypothetical protein